MRLNNQKFALSRLTGLVAGHRTYRKFVVLTRSRTGSSLLIDGLGSHPAFVTRGEVFRRRRPLPSRFLLDQIWGRHRHATRAVGFKIFYYHPNDYEDETLWSRLADTPDLHVIHLERKDVLSLVLSQVTAANRNAYHNYGADTPVTQTPTTFDVDIDATLRGLEKIAHMREKRLAQFSHLPSMTIDYSELSDQSDKAFDRVFDFLGFPPVETQINVKKTQPVDYPSLIGNFDTLVSALSNAGWITFENMPNSYKNLPN